MKFVYPFSCIKEIILPTFILSINETCNENYMDIFMLCEWDF